MAHGGSQKHRVAGKPVRNGGNSSEGLGVKRSIGKNKVKKKPSVKNQIRAVERLLKKNLPTEVQAVQRKRLEDLKNQAEDHQRAELERKMALRYHKVKFFERRKIERRIKHLEKLLEGRDATETAAMKLDPDLNKQLVQLKEDLEYVRFFPRTEKYVSLFEGNEDEEVLAKRTKLREQIKANIAALKAAGVEPEDMLNDEDPTTAMSDDDFFLAESLSDNAEAGNESPFTSSKTQPKSTSKKTTMPNASHTSVSSKKQSYKVSHNELSGSKNHKQRPMTMSDDDFFLAENLSDNTEAGDQVLFTSSRHTSVSNKEQSYKFPHNLRSGSDSLKQRSAPIFRNKGLLQDNQRHYRIGADNKIKGQNMNDQMHHSVSKDNKMKEHINIQKPKFAPYSSSLSQSHSGHQQARSKPTSSRSLNAASSVIAKNNSDDFNVPSRASLDAAKNATVAEIGSSSLLAPKKRRRKHRPKKKKT